MERVMTLSETLRQLADDIENRPNDKCWLIKTEIATLEATAETAVGYADRHKCLSLRPPTSRERFEAWAKQHEWSRSLKQKAWAAWQEAERQAGGEG